MSELDQTIEELEAEVMAELEEKASLPGGAGLKAEPMKQDDDINDPLDNVNDTGPAHVDADAELPDAALPKGLLPKLVKPVKRWFLAIHCSK